jgi:hypothetical protein
MKRHEEKKHRICAWRHALCALLARRGAAGDKSSPRRFPRGRVYFASSASLGGLAATAAGARLLGKGERLADLAAELVRMKVSIIVTAGTRAAQAAKKATTTIPIVMATSADPVGEGLVASLSRPGGNVTGEPQCRRS